MLAPEIVRQVKHRVGSADPAAALLALEPLGWGGSDAHAVPCPGLPALDRLVLGSYPTRATVARREPGAEGARVDRMAYFAGHRWCLDVRDGALVWNDFSAAEAWSVPASQLTAEALQGFTPSYFARLGRFEPTGGARRAVRDLPPEDATEHLLARVDGWWQEWLGGHVERGAERAEKERFVHILSALLLLKTIEDLDRVRWLRRGTLRRAARAPTALPELMRHSASALNSRVLRAAAQLAGDSTHWIPLVTALDAADIDYASLEIDPVGMFYERVLGVTETVSETRQRTLPGMGRGQEVARDLSARRRLGAFFTPRSYADVLARHLVLPGARIAEEARDLPAILDPAAGSGELLCAALREVFSEHRWRRAEVARAVLGEKLWAVDVNPMAVHLAALNVLRTTVRLVPEVLDDGRPFPSLDENFIAGDALGQRDLDKIPQVDVVLLNPPFKGRTQWKAPEQGKARVLDEVRGPVNLAFALLSVALEKVREGGAVGAVMPSQLFSGVQHRGVREHVARQLRIETVVVNHGSPFPDAQSYAGLVWGHRLPGAQLPRTEVITIPGGVRNGAADVAALLYASADRVGAGVEAHATAEMVSIEEGALWNWTGVKQETSPARSGRAPRVALKEVLLGGIHHGVVAAPEAWGWRLFLFDDIPGGVVHHGGRKVLDDRSPALRAFARPRMLQPRVPNLCEPVVPGARVFLPGDGFHGVLVEELREVDPVGGRLADSICARVLDTPMAALANRSIEYRAQARKGVLRFNWPKSYVDVPVPQVILSKANRSPVGTEQGVPWSAWVNLDGSVVPLGGLHVRAISAEHAILAAVLLNVPAAVNGIIRRATVESPRNEGTTEPYLPYIEDWEVPDISAGVYHGTLEDLVGAFHEYRREAAGLRPSEAHGLPSYRAVLDLGEKLWRL